MKLRLVLTGISVLFIGLLCNSCNSNRYNYSIVDYILTLEPRTYSPDVKATIEITYLIEGNKPKEDGFKFVGKNVVDSLTCSDENGPLTTNVEYLNETRISWQFAPVSSGTKKIKATFILRNFLEKKDNNYEIKAPWAGVFRVPVINARYKVFLPVNLTQIKCIEPSTWQHQVIGSTECLYYLQSPLNEKAIKIQFEL